MGVLEQVMQMKNQGSSDEEITALLREEGFSPRDIKNALDQSRIKNAVSRNEESYDPQFTDSPQPPTPMGGTYTPQTAEIPEGEAYNPEAEGGYYYPEQTQEYYGPESSAYSAEGYNSDTMIEIAEQVFSEKTKKINKGIAELNEFKVLYQTKIENALERIKRIESIIDNLQVSILNKIGSYGENLENVKKEMSMVEDSLSKMIPSLAHKTTRTSKSKKTKK